MTKSPKALSFRSPTGAVQQTNKTTNVPHYVGYKSGDFPNSEYAAKHTIALPIYPELTTEMQDYVIEKIGEFYE